MMVQQGLVRRRERERSESSFWSLSKGVCFSAAPLDKLLKSIWKGVGHGTLVVNNNPEELGFPHILLVHMLFFFLHVACRKRAQKMQR